MYLQDSLMIQVNNDRKTIWLSRVDVSTKEKMNTAPAGSKEMKSIMSRDFFISKSSINSSSEKIKFETRQERSGSNTAIEMLYDPATSLPQSIIITVSLRQPADEDMIAAIKEQQIDEKKLIQEINGTRYVVRSQQVNIMYTDIDSDKQKLSEMPLYKSCISYNAATREFAGAGKYKDYEVTKLF
jgi:hypothetical protein